MTIDGSAPPASPGRFGAATPGLRPAPPALEALLAAPEPKGRRRLSRNRVLLLVALVLAAAAGYAGGHFYWPFSSPPRPTEFAVTATALPAGMRLSPADFRTVSLTPGEKPPAGAMTPAQAAGLTGLVTAHAVPAGTFIAQTLVTSRGALPDSVHSLVGLSLKPGQDPFGGLAPGQQVEVVLLRVNQAAGTVRAAPIVNTTVWDVSGPDSSGNLTATVVVPAHLAPVISAYAAQGNVALVATGRAATSTGPSPSSSKKASSPRAHPTPSRSSH